MQKGREAAIIIDSSITARCPLIELQALAAKAVTLLACRRDAVKATIYTKPREASSSGASRGTPSAQSYWVSLADARHRLRGLFELRPSNPATDFEVVSQAAPAEATG